MKTRTDFVSNSSSCSFVIKQNASKAAKMFLSDFSQNIINDMQAMGDTMNIGFKIASKSEDDWLSWQSPSQFVNMFSDNTFTNADIEQCSDDEVEKHDVADIVELSFECDDYDFSSMSYLALIYRYFKKFGFNPDTSESEHDFIGYSKSFLEKIFEKLEA